MNPFNLPTIPPLMLQTPSYAPPHLQQLHYPPSLIPNSPMLPEILHLLSLRNSLQNQLLNSSLLQQTKLQMSPPLPHLHPLQHKRQLSISTTGYESSSPKSATKSSQSVLDLPDDPEIRLEAQVKFIIHFFINNYGKIPENDFEAERAKYSHHAKLTQVFDVLALKYASTNKTKEELVKWVLRKAIRATKKNIKADLKLDQRELSQSICKRYFKEGSPSQSDDAEELDELADTLLPFKKNSKNKTMNSSFITEIFSSEEFRNDYSSFMDNFDQMADGEISEKVPKFVNYVMKCVKKDNIQDIAKYKRMPWLKLWAGSAKKIAEELNQGNLGLKSFKKRKSE